MISSEISPLVELVEIRTCITHLLRKPSSPYELDGRLIRDLPLSAFCHEPAEGTGDVDLSLSPEPPRLFWLGGVRDRDDLRWGGEVVSAILGSTTQDNVVA